MARAGHERGEHRAYIVIFRRLPPVTGCAEGMDRTDVLSVRRDFGNVDFLEA